MCTSSSYDSKVLEAVIQNRNVGYLLGSFDIFGLSCRQNDESGHYEHYLYCFLLLPDLKKQQWPVNTFFDPCNWSLALLLIYTCHFSCFSSPSCCQKGKTDFTESHFVAILVWLPLICEVCDLNVVLTNDCVGFAGAVRSWCSYCPSMSLVPYGRSFSPPWRSVSLRLLVDFFFVVVAAYLSSDTHWEGLK